MEKENVVDLMKKNAYYVDTTSGRKLVINFEDAVKLIQKAKREVLDCAFDASTLSDWYQNSIVPTAEPIWTDKHIQELTNDFVLIPKYGHWIEDIHKD